MTNYQFAVKYLKAVERHHKDFFDHAKLRIMNCVAITGKTFVSVELINQDLPYEIRHEIETMFWIE